nr:hypothetical protein [Maliibacterium massiliense]
MIVWASVSMVMACGALGAAFALCMRLRALEKRVAVLEARRGSERAYGAAARRDGSDLTAQRAEETGTGAGGPDEVQTPSGGRASGAESPVGTGGGERRTGKWGRGLFGYNGARGQGIEATDGGAMRPGGPDEVQTPSGGRASGAESPVGTGGGAMRPGGPDEVQTPSGGRGSGAGSPDDTDGGAMRPGGPDEVQTPSGGRVSGAGSPDSACRKEKRPGAGQGASGPSGTFMAALHARARRNLQDFITGGGAWLQ